MVIWWIKVCEKEPSTARFPSYFAFGDPFQSDFIAFRDNNKKKHIYKCNVTRLSWDS